MLDGVALPLVGRVSMDLLTFDVTDAPAAAAGRHVTLIGDGITPDDLAAAAGTIGYEILTSLGARYRRVWQ
jgi:alanine racemase